MTDPERWLADLEPVGWRLGLERMRALCTELGEPQAACPTLHVVGTNGKTSVTLMTAALLEASGLRTGVCISPHTFRWSERTRIGGAEIEAAPFAEAVAEVATAVEAVERGLPERERVTQFEAAIAASFVAFRNAGVDSAVVEAGLGGRLDATNVIHSAATALTSVALDHTEWLGDTRELIALEKLAVLEEGSTLVVGALEPEIDALAASTALELGATLLHARVPDPRLLPAHLAPFLRRNAGVAVELARALAPQLSESEIGVALGGLGLAGRAELIDGDPPVIADVAHNEEGALALAKALPGLSGGRGVHACISVLADKDTKAIAAALSPALSSVICTAADPGPAMGRPGARALGPEQLGAAFARPGLSVELEPDPALAVQRAIALARSRHGVALCVGSHYLLRYLWTVKRDQSSSR